MNLISSCVIGHGACVMNCCVIPEFLSKIVALDDLELYGPFY